MNFSNTVFSIAAPPGWVLDTASGLGSGLPAVFYPAGASWDGPIVMYVNSADRATEGSVTLATIIEEEVRQFEKRHAGIKVRNGAGLAIADGRIAIVKEFAGGQHGRYEAVAYIDQVKTINSVTLSADTEALFEEQQAAFRALVKSCVFISDEVIGE